MSLQGNQFYFIRHAKTEWNEKSLCQGWRDIPLNNSGKEEALKLGQQSQSLSIEMICSSPLLRAYETAQFLQQFHPHAPIKIIDELKERGWGELEGISSQKMYEIEEREEKDPSFDPSHGVEPRSVLRKRLIAGINQAMSFHPRPFIVSHGRAFLILCEALGIPPIRQIPNLAVIEFTNTPSGWSSKIIAL